VTTGTGRRGVKKVRAEWAMISFLPIASLPCSKRFCRRSAISCARPIGRSGGRAASTASARWGQEATVDQIVEAPIAG
jgi:hypothetical protein